MSIHITKETSQKETVFIQIDGVVSIALTRDMVVTGHTILMSGNRASHSPEKKSRTVYLANSLDLTLEVLAM